MVCKILKDKKYKNLPTPPYDPEKCKYEYKKGNDGLTYETKRKKNGKYEWVLVLKTIPKACKIKDDQKYKDRPSPSFSAQDCPNVVLMGNDEKDYISVSDKNGVYHWKILKNKEDTNTAEEYYTQFPENSVPKYDRDDFLDKIKKVEDEFKREKMNIYIFHVKWKNTYNFIDDAWSEVIEILQKKYNIKDPLETASFIFYTDHRFFWAGLDSNLTLQHNIKTSDKDRVIRGFKKYFGKNFEWNGSPNRTIDIKLNKIK